MDLDVVRVVEFQLELLLKEMKDAKNLSELEALYSEAEDNLEAFYNALKAKLDKN